jgi:hypothetical protein
MTGTVRYSILLCSFNIDTYMSLAAHYLARSSLCTFAIGEGRVGRLKELWRGRFPLPVSVFGLAAVRRGGERIN